MQVSQFPCPHCAARLRLRDRSFAGRTIPCPECHRPVTVALGADGRLTGLPASTAATAPQDTDNTADAHRVPPPFPVRSPKRPAWRSPATIGWITAIGAAVAVLAVVFLDPETSPKDDPVAAPPPEQPAAIADDSPRPEEPPPPQAASPLHRLTTIADSIARYRVQHGHFPGSLGAGLPPSDRLSWLAALALQDERLKQAQPLVDHPWDDPLNDRFVRQRVHEFQNPLIEQIVGDAGYPAAHFAGIAGVGVDAPMLPKDHPRAGIFGEDRIATADDVRDGLANTLLVAGVQAELSSWAANGRGTVRPFTAEPYINGPDGFGTGEADGMHVLMADGSVRFLADGTDPRLMRRMAAMADGLPLDLAVPGEPGSTSADSEPLAALPDAPQQSPQDARPIDVPLAPDEPFIDVESALSLPVLRFAQTQPVRALTLLRQLEELGGVPIDATAVLESPAAQRLDQPVTLELDQTTFGDLLQALLGELDVSFSTGPRGIILHPSPASIP